MKRKETTIIDVVRVVQNINRAGRFAGITAISKLLGVTPSRAKKLLNRAIAEELVYAFNNNYRPKMIRLAYSPTECGLEVLYCIDEAQRRKLIPDDQYKWKTAK